MVQDVPKLQVFFDSGKVEVPAEFADKAKAGCPVSKLLKAEISLDASLA